MSADFWAGYISGAAGIILGNPLDVLKVRLQAGSPSVSPLPPTSPTSATSPSSYIRPFLLGTAAPVLGYGALNALLFVSYNRTEAFLNSLGADDSINTPDWSDQGRGTNLLTTWLAGAVGGLATWAVSTPTELIKCRTQIQQQQQQPQSQQALPTTTSSSGSRAGTPSSHPTSSWSITKQILRTSGPRGLYAGGTITVLRDSIGYGFYFWGYELCSRWMHQLQSSSPANLTGDGSGTTAEAAARVLLCGGLAGVLSWASIFPLDVVKTRVQTQDVLLSPSSPSSVSYETRRGVVGERRPLLLSQEGIGQGQGQRQERTKRLGAWAVAKETYRAGGPRAFFRGLAVCSVRAFIVNAVQWAVYEWIMMELGQGRRTRQQEVVELSLG